MNKLEIEYNTIKDYTITNKPLELFGGVIEGVPMWGYVVASFIVGLIV